MFVQFSDETHQIIISVFMNPQDEEVFPNQGEVDETDARYMKFMAPTVSQAPSDPVEKLKKFLEENPDVVAILG